MAYEGKSYLDLTGLTTYDGLIKNYIDTEDAKAIKFVKISTDGNNLLLYKDKTANAQTAEASADFTIPMGSAALRGLITSLGTAAGAVLNQAETAYSTPTFTGDIASATSIAGACQLLDTHIGTLASLTTTEKTSIVNAINEIVAAIADLDVAEFALATESNGVVTIKGIKETDGKIAVGTDTTKDVTLAKVATTGAAEDIATDAITDGAASDPTTLYAAGDAQTVLESIARDLNDMNTDLAVTCEKQTTAESGYAATYVVKQGGSQVGDKINIPLDYLVKSATIKTVTAADKASGGIFENDSDYIVGDKYIDFEVNVKTGTGGTESHIYLLVKDLVHPLSGSTTTVTNEYEMQISVDANNQISATLNNIYALKVQYSPTSANTVIPNVTTVKGALDAIDSLVQSMDADLDASSSSSADAGGTSPLAVVTGVTQADGTVTAVDSGEADPFGAAAAVYGAMGSIADASIEALFSSGGSGD